MQRALLWIGEIARRLWRFLADADLLIQIFSWCGLSMGAVMTAVSTAWAWFSGAPVVAVIAIFLMVAAGSLGTVVCIIWLVDRHRYKIKSEKQSKAEVNGGEKVSFFKYNNDYTEESTKKKIYSKIERGDIISIIVTLYTILDSQGEKVCDIGSKLVGNWPDIAIQKGIKTYAEEVRHYQYTANSVAREIMNHVNHDSIYAPEFSEFINMPRDRIPSASCIHEFVQALNAMPDDADETLLRQIEHRHEAFQEYVRGVHNLVRGGKTWLSEYRQNLVKS